MTDRIIQIMPPGQWCAIFAEHPPAPAGGWGEERLACWALTESGKVYGLVPWIDGGVENVEDTSNFIGYGYAHPIGGYSAEDRDIFTQYAADLRRREEQDT